jgi:hypothetical protein
VLPYQSVQMSVGVGIIINVFHRAMVFLREKGFLCEKVSLREMVSPS